MGGNQVYFQREKRCTHDEHRLIVLANQHCGNGCHFFCLNQTNSRWNSVWGQIRGPSPKILPAQIFSAEKFPHHAVIHHKIHLNINWNRFSFRIYSGLLVVSTNGINGNPTLCSKKTSPPCLVYNSET
ncbi:MAG: hypothetical protein Ct9H300mP21_07350 [Pseudomonadota bacterium]|nr:MAG: hypothetical protein Ct9H300mP21_07350 [Pseudomonadota bacterium]